MRVKTLFSNLKVNSIVLILTALVSNSKIVLSVNNGDESTSKQEKTVQKHLKLNPLKEKNELRTIKIVTSEKLHISYIKSDKNIKNSYSKDKYSVIAEQKKEKFKKEWDEMLRREQMLGDMDLVLKDNPLLSTQSICKGVDFINNSELNLLEQKSQIQVLHSINEGS